MRTISIKQLHAETGRWVCAKGQPITVTDHGESIATLQVFAATTRPRAVVDPAARLAWMPKVTTDSTAFISEDRSRKMTYWDTSYLAKLYLREAGTDEVLQAFSAQGGLVCGEHGQLELMAALKRNQREGLLTAAQLKMLWRKHAQDLADGLIDICRCPPSFFRKPRTVLQLPPRFLSGGDPLHLACASEAGLKEIYSHDRHLLAAAPHFGPPGPGHDHGRLSARRMYFAP